MTGLQQTCIAATPHLTRHALSLCHMTILTNALRYTYTLVATGLCIWPTDRYIYIKLRVLLFNDERADSEMLTLTCVRKG